MIPRPARRNDPEAIVSKHSISLPPSLASHARAIGNGNMSAGVKIALEACQSKIDDQAMTQLFYPEEFEKHETLGNTTHRLNTCAGSITVMDRMTGYGYRDIESGYRDLDGKFWLASGCVDVRESGAATVYEAIAYIKSRSQQNGAKT